MWCQPGSRIFWKNDTITDLIGEERAANSTLHIIDIGHLRTDDKMKEYVAR